MQTNDNQGTNMNRTSLGLHSLTKPLAWICGIWLVCALLGQSALAREPHVGGGPIRYNKYAGTAVIVRVEKTAAANANKGRATEGFEVWYTFAPKVKIPQAEDRRWLEQHKEHQFVLGSSGWCPGPKFLKKYGIEKGKKFAATLWVIEQGVSTPIFVKLDDVPDDDYFEAADP